MATTYYSTAAQNGTEDCWTQLSAMLGHLTHWNIRLVEIYPAASGRVIIAINNPIPAGQWTHMGMTTSTST